MAQANISYAALAVLQFGLQLLFQCQLPRRFGGLQGGALFLHTEGGEPPMKRLRQIGTAFASKWVSVRARRARSAPFPSRSGRARDPTRGRRPCAPPPPPSLQLGANCDKLCENIFVERIETADLLMNTLRYRVPSLLADRPVRLVVVDSIGALFRTHLDDNLPQRSQMLIAIAAEMKRLSERNDVAFVVINQVTDSFSPESSVGLDLTKRAALGLTWSHCVNTRILLSRSCAQAAHAAEWQPSADGGAVANPFNARRRLFLQLSPCAPEGSCEYVIDASGIRDVTSVTPPGPGPG